MDRLLFIGLPCQSDAQIEGRTVPQLPIRPRFVTRHQERIDCISQFATLKLRQGKVVASPRAQLRFSSICFRLCHQRLIRRLLNVCNHARLRRIRFVLRHRHEPNEENG